MPFVLRSLSLVTLAVCCAMSGAARADLYTWIASGDGFTWTDTPNWSSTAPGSPTLNDTAIFNQNATVAGGEAQAIVIDAGVWLALDTDRQIIVVDKINNRGVLTFSPDTANTLSGIDTTYRVSGNVRLDGGGEVLLNGIETGFRGGGTLTNFDNLIRGSGSFDINVVNQHRMRVEGGTVELHALHSIDNRSGTIEIAADGHLKTGLLSTIRGGSIFADPHAANGVLVTGQGTYRDLSLFGFIRQSGATFRNIVNHGVLQQIADTASFLEGTITNHGVITFEPDRTNSVSGVDTTYRLNSNVTLDGGGQIVLTGLETGLRGEAWLTNVDNLIRGSGVIDVNVDNRNRIIAKSGTIDVRSLRKIQNSLGVLEIASDGQLKINLDASLTGGLVQSATGAQLRGQGEIRDATIAGDLNVDSITLRDVTLTGKITQSVNGRSRLEGTINNQGILTFTPDSTHSLSNTDTAFRVHGTTTIEGGGEIVLAGIETGFIGAGTIRNRDNTIRGTGIFNNRLINQGVLEPGNGLADQTGTITINGFLDLAATSIVRFDIGGYTQGSGFDFILVNGDVVLGGQLDVTVLSAFHTLLQPNDSFVILKSNDLSGSFLNAANGDLLASSDNTTIFQVHYGAGSAYTERFVVLSVVSIIPEPSSVAILATASVLLLRRRRRQTGAATHQ